MGFALGRALGRVVSGAIRQATGGFVRPNFQRPSGRPQIGPTFPGLVPDSTVTTMRRGVFGNLDYSQREYYTQPGQTKALNPSGAGGGGGCPTGFRLNKSTYVTRGGGTSRWSPGLQIHEKGTECVRRRKINAGNGRAATRAVRRLVSFYRLSQRVAKQLRRAAVKAHVGGGRRGQRRLPAGRNVEVVNVE